MRSRSEVQRRRDELLEEAQRYSRESQFLRTSDSLGVAEHAAWLEDRAQSAAAMARALNWVMRGRDPDSEYL